MRFTERLFTLVPIAVLALAVPASAQTSGQTQTQTQTQTTTQTQTKAQTGQGVMGDLLRDVGQVEKKILGLARAMPQQAWDWRPGTGVRSTAEVFMHVAADNYYIPALGGIAAPAATGITKEYDTAAAFEKKALGRDATIAELEKSFEFLKKSMTSMPDSKLEEPLQMFGQSTTNRGLWIMATTHLHEHLGQLIAYARSNNVTPPWSK